MHCATCSISSRKMKLAAADETGAFQPAPLVRRSSICYGSKLSSAEVGLNAFPVSRVQMQPLCGSLRKYKNGKQSHQAEGRHLFLGVSFSAKKSRNVAARADRGARAERLLPALSPECADQVGLAENWKFHATEEKRLFAYILTSKGLS